MTMNEYLKTRSKKQLRQIIKAFCYFSEPLGCDADIMFTDNSEEPDSDRQIGFQCTHTGEYFGVDE